MQCSHYTKLHHYVVVMGRVVMDASAKTKTSSSLNDIQYTGTIWQDDLINLLLRFREGRWVVCGDIYRMYRSIYINPTQYNLQCILWRESPVDTLHTYNLTTLRLAKCFSHCDSMFITLSPGAQTSISRGNGGNNNILPNGRLTFIGRR